QTADMGGVQAANGASDSQLLRVITVQATATATVQIDPNLLPPTALDESSEPARMQHIYLPLLER
ncbi:MAG: hypothetical protein KDE54_20520, partial [Caldilineaceae bacterium]|nr:hypothetical protein [Caldilineaceae bacterium]